MKQLLIPLLASIMIIAQASSLPSAVKADDLIVQRDGAVVLVITSNGTQVLAESTSKGAPKQDSKSQPPKTVVLAPASVQSVVSINPKTTSNKKIQVTVSTNVPTQNPALKTPSPLPPSPTSAESPITKTVDKVVAEGINGQSVLTIRPNNAGQITITQENTDVSTALPLQIDTVTHAISNQTSKISVLPREAASGASQKINNGIEKISLTSEANVPVYKVQGNEVGNLLGLLPVQSPVEVALSAQTGRIIRTSESPVFRILGPLLIR